MNIYEQNTSNLNIGHVQNLVLELQTCAHIEPFRIHCKYGVPGDWGEGELLQTPGTRRAVPGGSEEQQP